VSDEWSANLGRLDSMNDANHFRSASQGWTWAESSEVCQGRFWELVPGHSICCLSIWVRQTFHDWLITLTCCLCELSRPSRPSYWKHIRRNVASGLEGVWMAENLYSVHSSTSKTKCTKTRFICWVKLDYMLNTLFHSLGRRRVCLGLGSTAIYPFSLAPLEAWIILRL
jgi:hypothetical protein